MLLPLGDYPKLVVMVDRAAVAIMVTEPAKGQAPQARHGKGMMVVMVGITEDTVLEEVAEERSRAFRSSSSSRK